ncbi:Signal peptidase I (EC [Olavius algarvensis associated proteobacterium Delta 3]|nr:Signal peptidase I (EC [Olavius algarvensis associated proteobacterium Delta 3]CAB5139931.1 Signal peptidase I (EC [Olavius algarvensis associated proteobacterium Delta 3]
MKQKPENDQEAPKDKKKSGLRENIEAILIAIVLALFIRTFIVQAFKIPSGSMKETLLIGDHILVNKFVYGVKIPFLQKILIPVKTPRRGDIIVFRFPEEPDKDFIKRVIGIPGDVVEIKSKQVYINGKPMNHDFGMHNDPRVIPGMIQPRDNYGPKTVPDNGYFVLGDNRDHSYDSRFWGFVDLQAVRGKAFMIYWSWDKQDFGVRWGRIGNTIR